MATAASPTGGEKKKEDDRKKLTKVSVEDYNRFEKYTNYAYQVTFHLMN
jgi:hypothetical protein